METTSRQLMLPLIPTANRPVNQHLNFPLATPFTNAQLARIQRTMNARFPRQARSSAFTRYHRLAS